MAFDDPEEKVQGAEAPHHNLQTTVRFKLAFAFLCVINLVCAIDATILSVALPVSPLSSSSTFC